MPTFSRAFPRNSHYCQRHVNQEKYAECTRTRARRGLGQSLRVPRLAPPGAGSGDRSGSREAAAGRSRVCGSRVSSRPPGAARPRPRCALPQSPESGAETRAVSGFVTPAAAQAHPGERRRSRPVHFRGPFKVARLPPIGGLPLHQQTIE